MVNIEKHLVVTVEKGKGVRARKGRRLRDANYYGQKYAIRIDSMTQGI